MKKIISVLLTLLLVLLPSVAFGAAQQQHTVYKVYAIYNSVDEEVYDVEAGEMFDLSQLYDAVDKGKYGLGIPGATLAGWYVNGDIITEPIEIVITSDTKIKPYLSYQISGGDGDGEDVPESQEPDPPTSEPVMYTVVVDPGNGDTPATYTVEEGNNVNPLIENIPKKDGYKFIRWVNKDNPDMPVYEQTVYSNMLIEAEWEKQYTITVYFNSNNTLTMEAPEDRGYPVGDLDKYLEGVGGPDFREGYIVKGWSINGQLFEGDTFVVKGDTYIEPYYEAIRSPNPQDPETQQPEIKPADPPTEDPKVEEPVVEEPKEEQPVVEEPKEDEPGNEEQPGEEKEDNPVKTKVKVKTKYETVYKTKYVTVEKPVYKTIEKPVYKEKIVEKPVYKEKKVEVPVKDVDNVDYIILIALLLLADIVGFRGWHIERKKNRK